MIQVKEIGGGEDRMNRIRNWGLGRNELPFYVGWSG